MKKSILTTLIVATAATLQAGKITVSNNVNSPGTYTSLPTAIAAAAAGDTIYIAGSPTIYNSITINKKLTLIGAGYNPNKQLPYNTQLDAITIARTASADPSGTKIMGINYSYISASGFAATHLLSNITITRCNGGGISFSNYVSSALIYNNIIASYVQVSNPYSTYTVNICNNIFKSGATSNTYGNINSQYNFFNNLVIYASPSSGSAFVNSYYMNVYNNIIYGVNPIPTSVSTVANSIFSNNLTFGGSTNTFSIATSGGTISGTGNLEGVDPLFVNSPSFTFTYTADYHLSNNSPALTGGTAGSQIGIYGGPYPFPAGFGAGYQTSATAPIPEIYEMNVTTPLIPAATNTVNVQIKARKVD